MRISKCAICTPGIPGTSSFEAAHLAPNHPPCNEPSWLELGVTALDEADAGCLEVTGGGRDLPKRRLIVGAIGS